MRCCSVVVGFGLAACGFTHGSLGATDATNASGDALGDGATGDVGSSANCFAKWFDRSIRFDLPVALTSINTSGYDRDPFLTPDELTIYLSSGRSGEGPDVYTAKRATRSVAFPTASRSGDFSTDDAESKLSITDDGRVAVIGSDRDGTEGGIDVWEAMRASTTSPWPSFTRTRVMALESDTSDHDPTVSANGLRIYYAPASPYQHLAVASRNAVGDNFGTPVAIEALNSGTGDADPSPTADERILLYSSNRPVVGLANGNIVYATRASSTATFETPALVPDINTDAPEGDPHVSADGCRVYFARNVGGENWDIFVASAR